MVNKPCCIDIYSGDNVSDSPTPLAGFDQVKAQGIPFCIHKASEGLGYADPAYARRRVAWMNGVAVPVTDVDGQALSLLPVWSAYHFFHGASEASAIAEAKSYLGIAQLGPRDLPMLDWENVGASGYSPSAIIANAFCSTVEDALGRVCPVYGGNVPREQLTANLGSTMLDRFTARPFWFCAYGNYNAALLPLPWQKTGPWLWQDDGDKYGPGPHTIPGITTLCDNSTLVAPMTVKQLYADWTNAPFDPAAAVA
jgi:GH25 family lysozyme M1 (1,4-beta-N-acetylmuramidase)